MSRARNIKPGFFKNDLLVDLAFEYRLLFIGLWTMADREGRLEDRPMKIRMEVFPADSVDVNAGLNALHEAGFIVRYESGGSRYIQVLTWTKHQNPHVKEVKSTIPAPGEHRASTVQAPEIPERAGLIPDSLIPDSLGKPPVVPKGDDATAVLSAYHRLLPACQSVAVLNPKRKRRIADAVKLAKRVCEEQGWAYVPAKFWAAYFGECADDPWLCGDRPNPNNPRWVQNLDVLIAEDRFAEIMDKAISAMRGTA